MENLTRAGVTFAFEGPDPPFSWFRDVWETGEWEPETLEVIERFVKPGTTLVDVGAWLGPVSLWATHLGARAVAVEPDPVAVWHLRRIIEANRADIVVFAGAVSDHDGVAHVSPRPQSWGTSLGSSMTHLDDVGVEVPCLTLPSIFERFGVTDCSLVKMDIEGGESIVLEHVMPFLAERRIPLCVAMHEQWWLHGRVVEAAWFDAFEIESGALGGMSQVLAVPR